MSGIVRHAPPWNAYSVSHQTQRSGPVRRTNTAGRPTSRASPWSEWKISVMRSRFRFARGLIQWNCVAGHARPACYRQ
jgi:hypothetical protein